MSPNRPINVPGAPYRSRGIGANWDTAGARGCGKNEDRGARGVTGQGLDPDWRLRLAAFAELRRRADAAGGVVTAADLDRGFAFEGERIRLWDARRGIWRPRQLGKDGAALTVVTAPPRPGKTPPYDDQVGSDADWLVYRSLRGLRI